MMRSRWTLRLLTSFWISRSDGTGLCCAGRGDTATRSNPPASSRTSGGLIGTAGRSVLASTVKRLLPGTRADAADAARVQPEVTPGGAEVPQGHAPWPSAPRYDPRLRDECAPAARGRSAG